MEGTRISDAQCLAKSFHVFLAEKELGNEAAFCLDYIIASTQYEAFVSLMSDFRSMKEYQFDENENAGYSCFRWMLHS